MRNSRFARLHFAQLCHDGNWIVFATAKILKSKGVEFAVEPKSEVWGTMAIFKDIDGNQFVLSNKLG